MKRALLIVLLLATWCQAVVVDEVQERRIRIGLKLFRAVLSADEDIEGKSDSSSRLSLLVVYRDNRELAVDFARELAELGKGEKRGTIRGLPIDVHIGNQTELDSLKGRAPAGVYIAEELSDTQIKDLVKFGIENHVIVYSPFEGDVNRGILGGLAIETRVRPYINLQTMRQSDIRIKQFFLKVAKHFEP